MLLIVFFLVDNDIPVNENVVEQEELSGFRFFAAHFREDSLADEHSSGHTEWLKKRD